MFIRYVYVNQFLGSCYWKSLYSEKQGLGFSVLTQAGFEDSRINVRPLSPASNRTQLASFKQLERCNFHTRTSWRGQEPSSKVEETVKSIKEGKEEKEKEKLTSAPLKIIVQQPQECLAEKRSLWQKIWAEILHYYHGFRLLGLDMKVSAKLIWRVLQGKELSRREHRLVCFFL